MVFGKSPCYCILPLVFDILNNRDNAPYSVVIIVSPLMNDQITSLASKGESTVSFI